MRPLKPHSRGDRKIMQRYNTLWSKTDIKVLIYFKWKKKPTGYREIARTYGRSNYTTFKKSCDDLKERGYLTINSDKKYFPTTEGFKIIERGYDVVAIPLPYFETYGKELENMKQTEKPKRTKRTQ